MGSGSSSPPSPVLTAPPPIPPIPAAANPASLASSSSALAQAIAASNRSKAAKGMGYANTVETSPQGVTKNTNLAVPTLLGS